MGQGETAAFTSSPRAKRRAAPQLGFSLGGTLAPSHNPALSLSLALSADRIIFANQRTKTNSTSRAPNGIIILPFFDNFRRKPFLMIAYPIAFPWKSFTLFFPFFILYSVIFSWKLYFNFYNQETFLTSTFSSQVFMF